MLRKQYLKEHKPGKFSVLVIKGELDQHFTEVEGVTEELKRQDQMEWVRKVNEIKDRADEESGICKRV